MKDSLKLFNKMIDFAIKNPDVSSDRILIINMKKETLEGVITTVVPNHKEIDKGTLLEIIRQCKLKRDDFVKLL